MPTYVLPSDKHNEIVEAAYRRRGYTQEEAHLAARFCELAARHGIKTHNALKALHLDELFGSGNAHQPGCVPGAKIEVMPDRFEAAQRWNANRKLGQAVGMQAVEACEKMADRYGVGVVSVDQAFHYLWGGGYVMDSAKRGYIAYTNCTASLAEVVPFGGSFPTLGTNPHSWGFPTTQALGFPIVIDWATSSIAMGRVQQFKREGRPLPAGAAVDDQGLPTTDPQTVAALLPFGAHKGYGLALINELVAAMIGGSLPTIRSRPPRDDHPQAASPDERKTTTNFFFQVIHPEALSCGAFAGGRSQSENVQAVVEDILGHGNERCLLPGQIEHEAAQRSEQAGGLIFTAAEVEEFARLAQQCEVPFDQEELPAFETEA